MISRGIHDFVTLTTAGTTGQKFPFTIKQQRRRLEGVVIAVTGPSSTLTTPTDESFGRMLKRFRMRVNDAAGSRFAVDVEGVAALDEWMQMGGNLPWDTLSAYGNSGSAAFAPTVVYPFFFRHPQLEEPAGNLTSIPLYDLREDVTCEVELGGNTDIAASGFTASNTVRAMLLYRDVDGGEYIPSEWVSSDKDSLPASSNYDVELPSNGLLTSIQVQGYSATNKNTRQSPISSSGDPAITLYYGREVVRRLNPVLAQYYAELSAPANPKCSGSAVLLTQWLHSFLVDLMDDLPLTGAFGARSALNLTSIRAGGDVARLNISSTNSTSPCLRVTTRKFLGGPVDKIQLA